MTTSTLAAVGTAARQAARDRAAAATDYADPGGPGRIELRRTETMAGRAAQAASRERVAENARRVDEMNGKQPEPTPPAAKAKAEKTGSDARLVEARAKSRELKNHRGPGRKISQDELVEYVRKVRKENRDAKARAEFEYAYWIEGLSLSRGKFEAAFNAVGRDGSAALTPTPEKAPKATPAPKAAKAPKAPTAGKAPKAAKTPASSSPKGRSRSASSVPAKSSGTRSSAGTKETAAVSGGSPSEVKPGPRSLAALLP